MSVESQEGVIKFDLQHTSRSLHADECGTHWHDLLVWRTMLHQLQCMGQIPERYDGYGFGNISARLPALPESHEQGRFVVSGSQTSGRVHADESNFAIVNAYDFDAYHIESEGQVLPSSESMTHAAFYEVDARIVCVMHVHAPDLWRYGVELGLPMTDGDVPYGSTEMVNEIKNMYAAGSVRAALPIVMGGHEDGVIVMAEKVAAAGVALVHYLAAAKILKMNKCSEDL